MTITEPGVYDIPDAEYHRDPVPGGSLSHSGAKRLLPPSCPALYRQWADYGQAPKAAYDLGHAAHKLVLGAGMDVRVIDAEDWRTKVAKEQRAEAYAAGEVPLLVADWRRVHAMADALRQHPIAAALFDPEQGRPEVSLFTRAGIDGPMLRGRLDWLPEHRRGRLIIGDYKTTSCAEPEEFARSCWKFDYFGQAAWYLDLVTALGLEGDERPAFVLVAQETEPPYLVTVGEPDETALARGRARNAQAIEVFTECTATGEWPSYTSDVIPLSLPAWVERRYLEDTL